MCDTPDWSRGLQAPAPRLPPTIGWYLVADALITTAADTAIRGEEPGQFGDILKRVRAILTEHDMDDKAAAARVPAWADLNARHDELYDALLAEVMHAYGEHARADLYLSDEQAFNTRLHAGLAAFSNAPPQQPS